MCFYELNGCIRTLVSSQSKVLLMFESKLYIIAYFYHKKLLMIKFMCFAMSVKPILFYCEIKDSIANSYGIQMRRICQYNFRINRALTIKV